MKLWIDDVRPVPNTKEYIAAPSTGLKVCVKNQKKYMIN